MINGREITWDNIDDVLLKISQLEEVGIGVNSSHVAIMQYLESFHFKYTVFRVISFYIYTLYVLCNSFTAYPVLCTCIHVYMTISQSLITLI